MSKPPKCFFPIVWILIGIWFVQICLVIESIPLAIFFAFFCIYRAFFRDLLFATKQYNALAQTYKEENWLRNISFQEDMLIVTEGTLILQQPYSDIASIKEKDNKIWLVLKDKKVIRLYKDKFVDGSWEECRSFLEGKISS